MYTFVIIFILDCVLVSDLLYAYKLKYKDTCILSTGGIAYFGIGHYSVLQLNYDSMKHSSELCGLKNQV